jgi:hypothetical protein
MESIAKIKVMRSEFFFNALPWHCQEIFGEYARDLDARNNPVL